MKKRRGIRWLVPPIVVVRGVEIAGRPLIAHDVGTCDWSELSLRECRPDGSVAPIKNNAINHSARHIARESLYSAMKVTSNRLLPFEHAGPAWMLAALRHVTR